MIRATINGKPVEVYPGTTILEAARGIHVNIPVLCKHPDLEARAQCGICMVRIAGIRRMPRACQTPVEEGMDITTHDAELVQTRRGIIELIMSRHPNECLTCRRSGHCELQRLAADFAITRARFGVASSRCGTADYSTYAIRIDPRKCISCGRCIQVCRTVQKVSALCMHNRGAESFVAPANVSLADSPCVKCGQCSAHCPTGAITEYDDTAPVWEALTNPEIHTVAQIAPAVRVGIGETFGMPPGRNVTRKLYAALRQLGFNAVFDTNFAADLTIMEEGSEFIDRFANGGGALPLITSCCPAWIDFMEKFHDDMIPNVSTCKSPHQMLGALAKTYYAKRAGVDPAKVFVVSIMPCTAKKWEIRRDASMSSSGHRDVDVVLTTRELSRFIRQSGVDFINLPEVEADPVLGRYTGAATIFGATGGVMEAALRTAADLVTGKTLQQFSYKAVRGLEGVKETSVNLNGLEVRVAVAHGLGNVNPLMDRVRAARDAGNEPPWHFIEVMACPGGCVGGGGQPYGVTNALRTARAEGLYDEDEHLMVRKSHQNPDVAALYEEFLGVPLGETSHHLLHTHYTPRPVYAGSWLEIGCQHGPVHDEHELLGVGMGD